MIKGVPGTEYGADSVTGVMYVRLLLSFTKDCCELKKSDQER